MQPKYKRILLKISGEALAGAKGFGLDQDIIAGIIEQIKEVHELGVEIGIVIGAGNFWRGRQGGGMDRSTADYMGMLATAMNCLALQDAIEKQGIDTRVQTTIEITQIAEPFIIRKAIRHLEKGRIVIFGCGTGAPYFTTDTAAALKASEVKADVLLLAKNVDGIYDSDPKTNPDAKKFDKISGIDFIKRGLTAMDTTAVSHCMTNNMPVIAFGLNEKDSIKRAVMGEEIGTIIY